MKHFMMATDRDGKKTLVEWDVDEREVVIYIPTNAPFIIPGVDIKTGIVGEDIAHWEGRALTVLVHQHEWLKREYPTTELEEVYVAADEWCVRKSRKVKNVQSFLNNWLKKDSLKGRHASGVML